MTTPDAMLAALDRELNATPSRLEKWDRMVAMGAIDPDCATCVSRFGTREDPRPDTMAPDHRGSAMCESGGRPHCSCGRCF